LAAGLSSGVSNSKTGGTPHDKTATKGRSRHKSIWTQLTGPSEDHTQGAIEVATELKHEEDSLDAVRHFFEEGDLESAKDIMDTIEVATDARLYGALLLALKDKTVEQVWDCLKKGRVFGAMDFSASPQKKKFTIDGFGHQGDGSSMLGDDLPDVLSDCLSPGYPSWFKVCLCVREHNHSEVYRLCNACLDGDCAVQNMEVRSSLHYFRGQAIHSLLDNMVSSLRSKEDLSDSMQLMFSYKTTLEDDVIQASRIIALKPEALRMRAKSALHAYENEVVRSKLGHDPEYLDKFITDLKEASRLCIAQEVDCEELLDDLCNAAKVQEEAKLLKNYEEGNPSTPLKNLYDVEELGEGKSAEFYSKQLKKKALSWHPDKHVNSEKEKQECAHLKFMEVQSAREVIGDQVNKAEYDGRRKAWLQFSRRSATSVSSPSPKIKDGAADSDPSTPS